MSRRHLPVFLLSIALLAAPTQAQLFQSVGTVLLGPSTFHTVADFNLDGRLDIAKASAGSSKMTVYFGAADGSFAVSPDAPLDIETPTALISADFNHDGNADVAVLSAQTLFSSPAVRIFLGSPTGTFTPRTPLTLQDFTGLGAPGDFDEDGNLDLAIITRTPAGVSMVTLLRGNGNAGLAPALFVAPVTLPIPSNAIIGEIQALDLNGDQHMDLVMTVTSTSGVGLATALGDGRGSFNAIATMGNQPPQQTDPIPRMAVADFNGDQKPDVVMFGYLRQRVTIWSNSGGVLQPQIASSVDLGPNPYDIAAADFDLDGRMDWILARSVVSGTPELHVALGNGANAVTAAQGSPFAFGGERPLLDAGDFNGDRRQDLLVVDGNAVSIRVLLNIVPRPPTLLAQQIQFPIPPDHGVSEGALTLTATASSGLPVTFAGTTKAVCTVSKGVATFLIPGLCAVVAIQQGNQTYSPAPLVQVIFTVSVNTQSITFAPLPDVALDALPFTVSATASSGLPVSFQASPASVCTLNGATVVLIAAGQCSITASQAGNATFPPAASVTRTFTITPIVILGPLVESIKNAASYAPGVLTPASYGSLFGLRLTGATLRLRDAAGATQTLELTFSGATQINFTVPANVALGSATMIVNTPTGAAEFPLTIATLAPGIFSAASTGQGFAAGQALILNNDQSTTVLTIADGSIPVRGGTQVYLTLYGTGIRGHTPSGVFVTVAGAPVELLYAGPQGTFPALDQVNIRVPLTVGGFGTVEIRVTVDGITANVVTANFQ